MVEEHQLSERRACNLVGISRDSYRNPPQPDQLTRDLGERIVDIAHVRRRFGYRRIHDLLRLEFTKQSSSYKVTCKFTMGSE
jgi:putative transposase